MVLLVSGTPLGEASTSSVILVTALREASQASASSLAISARKGLEALIDLDAGNDA